VASNDHPLTEEHNQDRMLLPEMLLQVAEHLKIEIFGYIYQSGQVKDMRHCKKWWGHVSNS